jgi:DNA-directed RNA polymerase subunit N (RpoN/RPB10)
MIIPVRCFSCGKVIGGLYETYIHMIEDGKSPREALDELGLDRYCCRRILLAHVPLIDEVMPY